MQGQDAPATEALPEDHVSEDSDGTPWLIVAAVFVGLLAVGAAIMAFVDSDDRSDAQLITVTELIDTWNMGLNENDPELTASVLTEDGVMLWPDGEVAAGSKSEMERAVLRFGASFDELTRVSDVTKLGDDVYTFVQQFRSDGVLTRAVVVIELDGERASRIEWVSDFYGSDPLE
ncbi:MAG: hypothetical protein OES24_20285 [Acidimicrobiia bacterium]|nr:hypothetical protein [Acidimicrobiia bacterium]